MTPLEALIELFGRVGASQGKAILVNEEELSQWPGVAVIAMKSQKLITKARPAASSLCPGCENECVMPVHTLPVAGASSSFIVCDKRSDINRVMIPAERLTQWQCSIERVCDFVAVGLGMRRFTSNKSPGPDLWEIGMARGDKRSQMLCLQANDGLTLVIGDSKVPLAEFIEFHAGQYVLDAAMLHGLVDSSTTADERYTPSIVKREARKLETKALHESWQKKYRELKRSKPGRTDSWYALQISKMDIAKGRDAQTIRKNMKC